MRGILRPLFVLALSLALVAPAFAQQNAPVPPPPNNGGGGSGAAILGGLIGIVVTGIAIKAAEDAARNSQTTPPADPPPPKKTTPKKTTPPKTVEYRDVVLPRGRPDLFDGRPVILDAAYDPTIVLVVLDPGESDPAGAQLGLDIADRFDLELVQTRQLRASGRVAALYRLADGQTLEEVIKALAGVPGVIGVQPQYLFFGSQGTAPVADLRELQYAPKKLNAIAARATGRGEGVTIGLIDTGIDLAQPEFAAADIEAFDVMQDRPVTNRDHGTALAGLMLADNGFDGIAPGARLLSVRAFDTGPDGAAISGSFEIAAAIDLAVEKGARVLNLSFAGPRDPLVMSVLDAAADKGVIFIAAAGNGGLDAVPAYPGAHRSAIAVTATDIEDAIFESANRGYYIAVSAPGVDVLSPMPGGRYELLSGTSIATAHVTAIVALMLERNPDLNRDRILELLEGSAHDLGEPGHDADYGAGLADAEAAIMAASAE
jgi:subtilisin family serine protease